MIKLVKKRVLGSSKIPKFDAYPPMVICETEDYFTMLKNCGFIVQDVEEEKPTPTTKKEKAIKKEEPLLVDEEKVEEEVPVVEESVKEDLIVEEPVVVEEKQTKTKVQGIRKTTTKKK